MISKKLKKSKKSVDFNFPLVGNFYQLIKFQLKKGIKKPRSKARENLLRSKLAASICERALVDFFSYFFCPTIKVNIVPFLYDMHYNP